MSPIDYPPSVHAGPILGTHWPEQSEYVWQAFSAELKAEWFRLVEQESEQQFIKQNLAGQTGSMIQGITRTVERRDATLADRLAALAVASPAADSVRASIVNLKSDLYWIVMAADQKIKELESKAGIGAAAMLPTEIAAIIAAAHAEAEKADAARAAEVTAKTAELLSWTPQGSAKQSGGSGAASPLSTGMGQGAASPPLSPGAGSNIRPTDYTTMKDGAENTTDRSSEKLQPTTNNGKTADQTMKSDEARNSAKIEPAAATTTNPDKPLPSPAHSSPPMSSAPSSGGSPASSGGGPSSMIGQMMPRSMSSSPGSSSSPASSGSGLSSGGPASAASPAAAHAGGPGSPAGAGAPGGAGAAPGAASGVRGAGLAGAGSGIAESSARFASGAVNAGANALGAAGNVGSQVAQGAASAASAAAPAAPAAAPPVAASAPVSGAPVGGAPIGMMPAAAGGGPGVVNPVTAAPAVGGAPAGTPAAGATPVSSVGGGTPSAAGSSVAPVPLQTGPGVRGVGADGATGDALFGQAMDVGRDVVSAMVAQTLRSGHITIHYAVALVYERGGAVSAWMATSEGASYIPLGVRLPADVRLSVTDPVIGRELWKSSARAGGANPLDVVVRQAQEREMAAPGSRVLAIASSLPMDQVMDWAAEVSARPVHVDPKSITKPAPVDMTMAHRCAVAMPWEWQQANKFDEQERHRIASRHMYMAVAAGGLSSGAAEEVMDLFELGQPVPESLWHEVNKARFKSLIEYEMQMQSAGQGGANPARALASARAAEVILSLRHSGTAEGCADLLYAARLAGAPLESPAAVA